MSLVRWPLPSSEWAHLAAPPGRRQEAGGGSAGEAGALEDVKKVSTRPRRLAAEGTASRDVAESAGDRSLAASDGCGTDGAYRGFMRAVSPTLSHPLATVASMGRPRISEEPRVATAIRLPASLRDELQAAAAERDVSVNFLINRAVADYLRRLPAVESDRAFSPSSTLRRLTAKATS